MIQRTFCFFQQNNWFWKKKFFVSNFFSKNFFCNFGLKIQKITQAKHSLSATLVQMFTQVRLDCLCTGALFQFCENYWKMWKCRQAEHSISENIAQNYLQMRLDCDYIGALFQFCVNLATIFFFEFDSKWNDDC